MNRDEEQPLIHVATDRGKIVEQSQSNLILLIEDELGIAREIALELEGLGYAINSAETVVAGFEAARSQTPVLMIVDRMLNGVDSLGMIESLRNDGIKVPVLFISSLSAVDERIQGLKAGGDDYVTKPFAVAELAARVQALLRRSGTRPTIRLRVGPLKLDLIERRVWRGERELSLLPREFKLLEYLMRHSNQVVTRAMLFEDVWNYRFPPQTNNLVDVHIGKVRRKVDEPGEIPLIQGVRGVGFMLNASE